MIAFTTLLLCLSIPVVVIACSCVPPDVPILTRTLQEAPSVFRGVVVRKLKDSGDYSHFVVKVLRVFKGCGFVANESVVLGNVDAGSCGLPEGYIAVNGIYAFSGSGYAIPEDVKKQLGNKTKVKNGVEVNYCIYNMRWRQVTPKESAQLRSYNNSQCKCRTGLDCATPGDHYCDSGSCVAFTKPCPTPLSVCKNGPPCAVAKPCSTVGLTCYNNYCGGCKSFFVDTRTYTRDCQ
jgi:hypothetical protein